MIVFYVDRDGVIINSAPGKKYVNCADDVNIIPLAAEGLLELSHIGKVVVISNQAGVGYGYLSHNDLHNITVRMLNLLPHKVIDAVYYCTHTKEAACSCRKPNIGLIEEARKEIAEKPIHEFFVGDFNTDMLCAAKAECIAVGVARPLQDPNPPRLDQIDRVMDLADIYAPNLLCAANAMAASVGVTIQ
jgi:histidinol-phosphate phosphatase family protein